MSNAELANAYAALILADEGIEITSDKLTTIIKAAGVPEVEPIWSSLFAKALEGKDVKDMLLNRRKRSPTRIWASVCSTKCANVFHMLAILSTTFDEVYSATPCMDAPDLRIPGAIELRSMVTTYVNA
ncbi:60S acidic ribosomal protein P1 [Cyphellophora attinorum]|uniref:Large ribosomal subunit protein P1 n=1 Tax=Cyphellophora attinorum TaxID=1664694 RepID=A0A0N0NL08_9EURO|nr:60S acidic ribosomal protein P1 [Phialophora attinorum]KPI38751.1 60S acidic ribosomal protein P1 [Phialophora attinorum]